MGAAMLVFRNHFERMQDHRLGAGDAFAEPVRTVCVHQKPDAAAVHSVNRKAEGQEAVEGLQHEAVAAERHDDIGTLRRDAGITGAQFFKRLLRGLGLCRDGGDPARRRAHPPVTLIWRAMAGRLWRRSMMKSWPFGLRSLASRVAASSTSSPSDWRSGVRRSAASSWPRHMKRVPVQVKRTRLQLSQKLWVNGVIKPSRRAVSLTVT